MEPTDAAYLAGLLDGEGSYMIRKESPNGFDRWEALITMCTTDDLLTVRAKDIAGGYICGPTKPKQSNARPAWIWTLKGKAVGPTIEAMWPYIVLKRPQAALLHRLRAKMRPGAKAGQRGVQPMHHCERYERETMRLACRALNHRGTEQMDEALWLGLRSADLLGLIKEPRISQTG